MLVAIGLWLIALVIVVPGLIDSGGVTPTAIVAILSTAAPSPIPATIAPSATVTPSLMPSATITPFVQMPLTMTATDVFSLTPISTTATDLTSVSATVINGTSSPVTSVSTDVLTAATAAISSATTVAGTTCAHPVGWQPYQIATGDTLFGFVMGAGGSDKLSVQTIVQGNCLANRDSPLTLGQILYLPPGIGSKSPKIGDGPAGGTLLPIGVARTANCPCTISVAAGWRLEQIATAIDGTPVGFSGRDFLAATNGSATVSGFDFLASKPPGASLEGFMYAGRYALTNSTTAANFRDMLLNAFGAALPGAWRSAAGGHGGLYNSLILASVIQRESTRAADQPIIASVFYNRLNVGSELGSSVGLQYALGRPGDWWPSISASDVHSNSPYNTLKHKGLPPTPIDTPGLGALQAAIYPASSPYIYFAQSCTSPGEDFSQTYAEFQAKLTACGN